MPIGGKNNPEMNITAQGGDLVDTARQVSQLARSARIPPSVVVEAAIDDPQLKADLITLFKIVRMIGGGGRGGPPTRGGGLMGSGQGLRPETIRQIQHEMQEPTAASKRRNPLSGMSKQRMATEVGAPIAQEILQSLI